MSTGSRPASKAFRQRLIDGIEPEWLKKHKRRGYIVRQILATPPWIKRADLMAVYARRKPGEVVDHIVPLTHPRVCGLNVPWNLKCVPAGNNARKSNAWCQWHGELFDQPEQLTLLPRGA